MGRPENQLAHAEQKGDDCSFRTNDTWESVSSVESVDELLILKNYWLRLGDNQETLIFMICVICGLLFVQLQIGGFFSFKG